MSRQESRNSTSADTGDAAKRAAAFWVAKETVACEARGTAATAATAVPSSAVAATVTVEAAMTAVASVVAAVTVATEQGSIIPVDAMALVDKQVKAKQTTERDRKKILLDRGSVANRDRFFRMSDTTF